MVITVSWFYDEGVPSIAGWTKVDQISDGSSSDKTSTAIFYKATADLTAEASAFTVTLTLGGDQRGIFMFLQNTDGSVPVLGSSKVSDISDVIATVPDVNVTRAGSLSILSCGAWGFGEWDTGAGGTQVPPSGFIEADPANAQEHAAFYKPSLGTGNVGGSFGEATERFAILQAVFQPALTSVDRDISETSIVVSDSVAVARNISKSVADSVAVSDAASVSQHIDRNSFIVRKITF